MALEKFDKQPVEVLDYDINFSDWMQAGDTINGLTVTADTGITVNSSSYNVNTHTVKVWLAAGIDGNTYKVTATITTTNGRTKQAEIKIKVREI